MMGAAECLDALGVCQDRIGKPECIDTLAALFDWADWARGA